MHFFLERNIREYHSESLIWPCVPRHIEEHEETTSTPHAKRARIDDSSDTQISSTDKEGADEQMDDAYDELTINELLQKEGRKLVKLKNAAFFWSIECF